MTRLQPGAKEGRYNEDSLREFSPKSVFGKYSDAEMVAQLKGLALNPCNSEFSPPNIGPLWNQTIRVRKAMALADVDVPRRKRKLQQLAKELPGFGSLLFNQQSGTKLSRGQVAHASSTSCLPKLRESVGKFGPKIGLDSLSPHSLLTFEEDVLEKQICSEPASGNGEINMRSRSEDVIPFVDSDESVNVLNASSPENATSQEGVPSPSNSRVQDTPIKKHLQPPCRSLRSVNSIGDDHHERLVIPVGPRFQADIPEWTGPQKVEGSDPKTCRWFGTRLWPVEKPKEPTFHRAIGEGRRDSCTCAYPANIGIKSHIVDRLPPSTECVQRHIIQDRLLLLCELGGAFFRMKLDETGEQISKSWTLEEQHSFELLARKYPPSDGKNFLKHAMKCFPNKCRKAIMSYYFNVFIPRRMSQQTRASMQTDTDDEGENADCSGRTGSGGSKDVKNRFLRQP